MKRNGKSSTPIIAAHAKKNNGHNGTTNKIKSLVLGRISDGILAFDAGMNHIYVNERAGEILGREPQNLLGKNFWEEYPESTGSPFADACQRAFETQTVVPFDGYFPPSEAWFEGRVYPSSDGLSVLISNDTDTKQEENLDSSQFPAQNPNPVMRFTRDGKLLYANRVSAPLLASWKGQTEQVLPIKLQELLSVVMETNSNQEVEIENQGKTYSCLLVPLREAGYVNLYFSDITERKQAQESIHALIHQTTTGIIRNDLHGRFLFANQAFCDMLGYSASELLGKPIWDVSHADDIAKNKRMFERMATEGEPYQVEMRIIRRNSSILWVTVGTSPLRDAVGGTYSAVSIVVDITRRKRAEESLLDSARRTLYLASLSDAIRSLPGTSQIEIEATRILGIYLKASRVAYAMVEADGTIIIRNNYVDGLADMIGAHNISEYVPNHALSKFRAGRAFVSTGAGKLSENGEPLTALQEATSVPAHVVIPLIRDGELVAALFVQQSQARDWKHEEIHLMEETAERMHTSIERARAEEALRSSEEKYRRIVESANEGIWEIDKDTRTIFVNLRMAEMLGYTSEEMMGRSSFEFLVPEDYSEGEHRLERAKQGASARASEFRYRRKDGSLVWTIASSTPNFDEQGNFVGGVAMISDITERKKAEEQIYRLNAELQSQLDETKALLDILPTGVWIGNHDCSVITGNAAAYQMMGLSQGINASLTNDDPQTPTGLRIFVNGEEVAPEDAPMQVVARSGKPIYNIEHDLLFPNGKMASVYASIVPLFDEHGVVRKVIGAYTDFTERKQDERALMEFARQQTALYKLADQLHRANTLEDVFNSSLDAITNALQCDRASILLFDETKIMHFVAWRGLSDEYRKATDGHSPWKYGEKNPVSIYFNDVESSDLSDSLKAVIKKEGIRSLAFIPLVYQGKLIGKFMVYFNKLHVFSDTELDLSLTVARQLASGVDRKRAEEALRQSQERFARFMQYLPGLAWIKDVHGRYIYANAAAEKAFNTPQEKLYGRTDQEIFPPLVASQFTQNDEQALLEGRGVHVVETMKQEDGVLHHSLVTKFPIPGPDGKTTLIGGTAFDITDRIQMEDALRQARKNAEQTADRLARLQEVTASLAGSVIPMQLAALILEQGTRATGAATGILSEVSHDGQGLKTIAALGYPEGTVRTEPLSLSEPTPMSDCIRTGRAVWIKTQEEFAAQYPHLVELRRNTGHESTVALPLIVGSRTLGGLAFSFAEQREFLLEERGFFLAVAQQCAQALERAHVEEARRESEERYRAIVNQATAGIVRKDAHGKLLFVNDTFCQMLGYSNSELINKTMWQLTHEEDVHENQRLFNRLMVEGVPFQLEKRLIRRDGSILWATVSVSPVLDSVGKPQSAVSVYSDITLRRLAEAELRRLNLELEERVQQRTAELEAANEFLRESEATARLILESMPDAILIADKDGQIVYGNNQVESLFGYSPKDVIGQPVEMLIPERFHENHVGHRQAYNGQRQRRSMGLSRDMFGQRKDNSEFPVDVMLSPISNNTSWDVMVTIRDNTEQKQAQQALRANEEKLRKLFEILPVGVSFINNEGQITEMNSALTHILGLSKRELLEGKFKPRQYIRSDGSPMPASEVASVRAHTEQKTIYNMETGIIKENGETIWTSVYAAPVNVAEIDIVVATIDITERKKAEEALHKNRERLRILSRRLVEVQEEERRALARELHDRVGQNLAALNLNLNILRGQLSTEALQIIGSRLDDSVALVNQILTITRSVMSDLRSNVLDDYGLESALREFAEQFTFRTGIQVVTDKQVVSLPRLDASIEMTLLRIAQEALTNVARHAQAKQATVSISIVEGAVYMSIQDDGIGILSWQRANQEGSHGLRIIRERAEAFGGSLQIHSTYKKGTRIEVKIPLVNVSSSKVTREKRS